MLLCTQRAINNCGDALYVHCKCIPEIKWYITELLNFLLYFTTIHYKVTQFFVVFYNDTLQIYSIFCCILSNKNPIWIDLIFVKQEKTSQSYRGHSPRDSLIDKSLGETSYTILLGTPGPWENVKPIHLGILLGTGP